MAEYTEEFNTMMEDNVRFICFSRTYSQNYNSVKEEMAVDVPPDVDIEKAHKWIRSRVNYWLQQDIQMMERNKFNMQGLKT